MKKYFWIVSALTLLASCSEDKEESLVSDNITIENVYDVGNNENASDIRVDFFLRETDIGDLQVLVMRESVFETLNLSVLGALTDNNYTKVAMSPTEKDYTVKLTAEQVDIDGNPIVNNRKYIVVIFSTGNQKLSEASRILELKNEGVLTGSFVGQWNDNLYTNFAISAELMGAGKSYRGPFYYTGNYTPCCGGSDDGSISITLDDEGNITFFQYDQDLLTFMGGCTGTYTGSGKLVNDFTLMIDFEGEDCEGPHTGGKIVLTKKF